MNVTMGTGQAPFNWVRWLDYCPGGLQLGEAKAPEAAKAAMAFFDAALPQFKKTANNVVFFAYKKHLTCIVSYLFVWYHSCII